MSKQLFDTADRMIAAAKRFGAQDAAASAGQGRSIEVNYRDGKLEKIAESTSSSVGIQLFVDGRYSSHSTSDLRTEVLDGFVERAVKLTRALGEDPNRGLADPKWYENQPQDDLQLKDGGYDSIDTNRRKEIAQSVMEAARSVEGPIVSVTAGYSDGENTSVRVHSNGLRGVHERTSFWTGGSVSVNDPDGRKPSDWHWVGARHFAELPDFATVGKKAAERALARIGQKQLDTANHTIVIENRTARRLLSHLLRPLYGSALQQKRSFLLDKKGQKVGNKNLTLLDDPLIPKGFGSRRFDSDGISARKRAIFEGGTLQEYLIDVYYARKMGVEPTGASTSNLRLAPGELSPEEIFKKVGTGIYVTGIQGGNSDVTRGDFSHGISGFEIVDGKLGAPVGEMNIAGNHSTLWNQLAMVGNDPYPYGSTLVPTLVFEDIAVSGA